MKYHNKKACAGQACCIHNPSKHHMVDWPLVLRESTLMERKCPHGIGHPDPDSLAYFKRIGMEGFGVHGCDGCCQKPKPKPKVKVKAKVKAKAQTRTKTK